MAEDIKARVINMLKENLEESDQVEELKPDDDLVVLGINSMTFIRLVIAAEMEFGIAWKDEDLNYQNFSTINNIIDYITSSSS